MGRNPISLWMAAGLLVAAGCSKNTDFETSRNRLIESRHRKSSRVEYVDAEVPEILPKTHYAAGRMFESQGNVAKAIEQYRKAIAVSHSHVSSYHRLGLLYSRLGRHDEAIEMFEGAVELKPDNPILRNNLGFELMFDKQWPEAAAQLNKAIELEPRFARAHINLGMALSKLKRYDEALAHFRRVLPETDAQYNLGLMYRAAQQYAEAATAFETVLEADPDFKVAETQLADITPLIPEPAQPGADATEERPSLAEDTPAPATPKALREFGRNQRMAQRERPRPEPIVIEPATSRRTALREPAGVDWRPVAPATHDGVPRAGDPNVMPELEPWASSCVTDEVMLELASNTAFIGAFPASGEPVSWTTIEDAITEVDDRIRCLVNETVNAMAVASPIDGWDEPMRIDPVLAESSADSYPIGNFIEDHGAEPIAAISWTEWDAAAGQDRRVRLRRLDDTLRTVRREIECLEAEDATLSASRRKARGNRVSEHRKTQVRTVADRPAERRRTVRRRRHAPMTHAYRPSEREPGLRGGALNRAPSRPGNTLSVPPTVARPGGVYSAYPAVETGPAFPDYGIIPPMTTRSQRAVGSELDFADLRDLLSITQNERRCREEQDRAESQEPVASESAAAPSGHPKGRVVPVRLEERRNPFHRR